jgi:preprotein translocase subunit SecA
VGDVAAYCEALGMSMGAGVARLIVGELETVVDVEGTTAAQLADQLRQQAEERSLRLDARQRGLETQAEGLRSKEERLRAWEQTLRTPQTATADNRYTVKVGRNERCPCGSGLKYKHCHGLPGRAE